MKTIRSEQVWYVDIDGTLVLWDAPQDQKKISMWDSVSSALIWLAPNYNNIRLLKEKKHRGCFIIVHSLGGWEYAEAVIKALCLTDFVDIVMNKPTGIIDDMSASEWMPKNVNIPADVKYKV